MRAPCRNALEHTWNTCLPLCLPKCQRDGLERGNVPDQDVQAGQRHRRYWGQFEKGIGHKLLKRGHCKRAMIPASKEKNVRNGEKIRARRKGQVFVEPAHRFMQDHSRQPVGTPRTVGRVSSISGFHPPIPLFSL